METGGVGPPEAKQAQLVSREEGVETGGLRPSGATGAHLESRERGVVMGGSGRSGSAWRLPWGGGRLRGMGRWCAIGPIAQPSRRSSMRVACSWGGRGEREQSEHEYFLITLAKSPFFVTAARQ